VNLLSIYLRAHHALSLFSQSMLLVILFTLVMLQYASDWIFVENNKDSNPGEIDLHGLYVKEAIAHTDDAIEQAKRKGDSEIHLIVGKGLHSQGGVAKIKPAIESLMQKHQLVAELDPHNAGVLIVYLGGGGRDRAVGPDEIARRLDRNDEGCIIM